MQEWHIASWCNAVSSGSVRPMRQKVVQNTIPKTVSLSLVGKDDSNLLHYYLHNAGCFLLNPLGSLTQLLLQIGLTDSSPSSVAVINALLAISALHVSGEARAITFKTKAIAMTRASLKRDNSDSVMIGNLAASMLLYLYETRHMSSPLAWAVYLCGAKKIILQSSAERHALSESYAVIFDWVLYHETIIEFSQLYWGRDSAKPLCRTRTSMAFWRRPELRQDIVGRLHALSSLFAKHVHF
ncbi:hypothetical protein F66182_861 [Fusarium sp. NRRL 66182]|nr:hypothetical protein F66182_861 [Fusarium sp. NRRL 66182]